MSTNNPEQLAVQQERERCLQILAIGKENGQETLAQALIDTGSSIEQAREAFAKRSISDILDRQPEPVVTAATIAADYEENADFYARHGITREAHSLTSRVDAGQQNVSPHFAAQQSIDRAKLAVDLSAPENHGYREEYAAQRDYLERAGITEEQWVKTSRIDDGLDAA